MRLFEIEIAWENESLLEVWRKNVKERGLKINRGYFTQHGVDGTVCGFMEINVSECKYSINCSFHKIIEKSSLSNLVLVVYREDFIHPEMTSNSTAHYICSKERLNFVIGTTLSK